jgi:hypothetical protein
MADEIKTSAGKIRSRKFRFAVTLLAVALALLAFEAFNYFSGPAAGCRAKGARRLGGRARAGFFRDRSRRPGHPARRFERQTGHPQFPGDVVRAVSCGNSKFHQAAHGSFAGERLHPRLEHGRRGHVKIPVTFVIDRNGVIQRVLFYA